MPETYRRQCVGPVPETGRNTALGLCRVEYYALDLHERGQSKRFSKVWLAMAAATPKRSRNVKEISTRGARGLAVLCVLVSRTRGSPADRRVRLTSDKTTPPHLFTTKLFLRTECIFYIFNIKRLVEIWRVSWSWSW